MLRKIICIASLIGFVSLGYSDEVSGRVTCDNIEWLYTIDMDNRKLVLEKAILLTSDSYHINMALGKLMYEISYEASNSFSSEGWHIWFGPSAFENNEYLQGVSFVHGDSFSAAYLTFCENSFKYCSNLGYICIDGAQDNIYIEDIRTSAFEGCTSMGNLFGVEDGYYDEGDKNVIAWTSLTNISERAFYEMGRDVSSSKTLKLSEGVRISAESFYRCGAWSKITLPSQIDAITDNTFYGCDSRIILPQQVGSIGVCAFQNAIMRGEDHMPGIDLILPEGLSSVESSAFEGATYKSLELPTSLSYIGSYAFAGRIEKQQNGSIVYPSQLSGEITIPCDVKYIGHNAFAFNPLLRKVTIQNGVSELSSGVFEKCFALEDVVIPNTVLKIASDSFWECVNLTVVIPSSVTDITPRNPSLSLSKEGPKRITFEGFPPKGIGDSLLIEAKEVFVPVEYKTQWAPYMRDNMKLAKKVNGEWVALGGKVISNAMRPSDPTIMDIKYKATSTKDKVNVRILAYKDGVRSFANALPLATFVDGTESNVGDGVAANVEHTVSWQVSKDWDADLAKVSVEVFVMEDNLLPLQLTTIPAMGDKAAVTFSRNEQSSEKVMNALYWLYADKTSDLTLENGVLKSGGKQLVNGTSLSAENALSYIYSKMGYGLLSGDTLKYVNNLMRSSISSGKFAVKEGAAE